MNSYTNQFSNQFSRTLRSVIRITQKSSSCLNVINKNTVHENNLYYGYITERYIYFDVGNEKLVIRDIIILYSMERRKHRPLNKYLISKIPVHGQYDGLWLNLSVL